MVLLIRAELHKIVRHKWVPLFSVSCALVYVLMTWNDYRWNDGSAWERMILFPYSSGSVFEGLMMLLALPVCFTQEYQLKTDALLLSSKLGRNQAIVAKITASIVFITVFVFGCWTLNAAANIGFAGWGGWDWPIQRLPRHESSPHTLVVWQYVLVQAVTNWLGCIVFGLFVLFLSARSGSYLVVFFIAGVVFVLPFFIHNTSDVSLPWLMKNLPMTDFMRAVNILNRHRFVNIGNQTIQLPVIIFYSYMILLAAILAVAVYRCFKNQESKG